MDPDGKRDAHHKTIGCVGK